MGEPAAGAPKWLDAEEMAAFLAYLRGSALLTDALDRDLQAHGLSLSEYECIALLSEAEDQCLRMSVLADDVTVSRSRLTHTANRLERRGWVVRRPCLDDRRGIELCLTELGRETVERLAPIHLASVRRHLVDVLSREDMLALGNALAQVRAALLEQD